MHIDTIPVISVSYNSAELIEDLLSSFRAHYRNPVTIIDGSGEQHYRAIEAVCARYDDVRFIHFDYNIHHGPGMAWAFQNLDLQGPVLVLDSDVFILKRGFLEDMAERLQPGMYGVGYVNHVNEGGYDVDYEEGAVRYLHPACMLVNIDVLRKWPMPTKHGAPMTEPMLALHRAGQSQLVQGIDWLKEDFLNTSTGERHYLRHDWQGTVKRSGSYGLDEWSQKSRQAAELRLMVQTLLPAGPRTLFELGANDALLARACKEAEPATRYLAAGPHPDKASVGKGACDALYPCNIDTLDDAFFRDHGATDCWILDQALERSDAPQQLLARIRKCIRPDASVVAVIPNAQHWGMLLRMATGDMAYAEEGLLSPGQRRWFSRATIIELFRQAGFRVTAGMPVIRQPLQHPGVAAALRQLTATMGVDPELAFQDAQPDLYLIKAVPC